jgi:MFS transporter, ACS family, glucarate transporter
LNRAANPPLNGSRAVVATSQERPTNKRFVVMLFLGSLAFITYFDRVCISRAKDPIMLDLNLTKAQFGLIMGVFWLAYALFELPAGFMGDRYGARSTLSRIVLAWSLFTCLSGSASGFASLLLYRFLFGVGEAGAFPNMARIQSRWLPVATRARASGMIWLMARWGGAFSGVLFGLLMTMVSSETFRGMLAAIPGLSRVAHAASWRLAFWVSGLIGLIWVITFWMWFRDHPSEKRAVNQPELELITKNAPPEVRGHTMSRSAWASLLRAPSLWAMGAFYLFGSFGWSFFVSWMPDFFNEFLKVPYEKSEWYTAGPLFFGGLSCIVGGTLSHYLVARTGRKRLFRAVFPMLGATTAAIAMFSLQYVRTPVQATVVLCIAAAAFDFGQAANWATIVDLGGKYAGTAAGFTNLVGSMGQAFQPYIGALIITAFGWNRLFIVLGLAYLVAAFMWLFIDPTRPFYEAREKGKAHGGFEVMPIAEPA